MVIQVLEGTWEEIAAHAKELAGKRLRVEVETEAGAVLPNQKPESDGGTILDEDNRPLSNLVTDIPVVGPPNEGMLAVLREIEERQKGRRQTLGDSVKIIRHGRTGPLYSLEPVDD